MASVNFADVITFTRASGGGRFNAQGQYEWLPANEPRIDYDPVTGECRGLLIEESRTNLLTYSSDFANAAWLKSNITLIPNTAIGLDGTVTASKAVIAAVAAQTCICRQVPFSANTSYTITVYAKAAGAPYLNLGFNINNFNYGGAQFDLLLGTVKRQFVVGGNYSSGAAPTIQDVGGGWFRCSVVISMGNTVAAVTWMISPSNEAWTSGQLAQTLTGDGTSGIYIWGAQLEAGAFATSYIPTTTAQVTRAADVAVVNELSPWYNASEGTLVVEFLRPPGATMGTFGTTSGLIGYTANSYADRLLLMCRANGAFEAQARTAGTFGIATSKPTTAALGSTIKCTLAFKRGNYAMTVNGQVPAVQNTDVATPPVSSLRIGNVDGGNYVNGHIQSLEYYPRRLSNTELQEITA